MAPGEYGPSVLGARLERDGRQVVPALRDAQRVQHVKMPTAPRIGEVIGLGVIGEDRGVILHFEMQASGGSGRIIPLGVKKRLWGKMLNSTGAS